MKSDKNIRDKMVGLQDLPEGTTWNSNTGWSDYKKQYRNVRKVRLYWLSGSVAAAAIIVLVLVYLTTDKMKDTHFANISPEPKQITIEGIGDAWLNKGSKINLAQTEYISITGKVYMEVKHTDQVIKLKIYNSIIIVEQPSSFNIKAEPDNNNIEIIVASGALKVLGNDANEGLTLLVTEGNYCSINKTHNMVYSAPNQNSNYLAWKTGELVFDNEPLATVLDVLQDYYHTSIELEDVKMAFCKFSGEFTRANIDEILLEIENKLDIEVNTSGNKRILAGKGC